MAIVFDWDGQRQEAGRQTAALNKTPGVMDPAALSATDSYANLVSLYGKDQLNANLMPGVFASNGQEAFKAELQKALGRPPTDGELAAFMGRLTETGDTAAQTSSNIISEIRDAEAAAKLRPPGQDADSPTASSQAPVGFSGGLLGYPYLPTGQQGAQTGFGGGMMGGNLLGGGFSGYPFTAGN